MSPDAERAAPSGEAGATMPLCECGHDIMAHFDFAQTADCTRCDCQSYRPVAAPRAGGAAEPYYKAIHDPRCTYRRMGTPHSCNCAELPTVGATSAPASEPTTCGHLLRRLVPADTNLGYCAVPNCPAFERIVPVRPTVQPTTTDDEYEAERDEALRDASTALRVGTAFERNLAEYIIAADSAYSLLRARLASQASALAAAEQEMERRSAVHLRRHQRLADALGMDPGYSVDATVNKAIEVIRAARLAPPAGGTGGATA